MKTLAFILCLLISVPAFAAPSAIVIDVQTNKVLYEENADEIRFPASLTKMMTLYLLFEELKKGEVHLYDTFRVSINAAQTSPSRLGLNPKTGALVEDLIQGVSVHSANDAAVAIAENLAGFEPLFADMMNEKAKALGMTNTTFRNASGLPNKEQKTTARDLVILSTALYKNFPEYYKYFGEVSFNYHGRELRNHNKMLWMYKNIDGIKTGWIRASGYNIAASSVREGRRLIGVVMGKETWASRNAWMAELLDKCYQIQ